MMLTFLELADMVDIKTPEEILKELQRILKI